MATRKPHHSVGDRKGKGIKIKEYKGKDCKKETLEKIFKRLHFPASIKGSLELNLEYI